MCGIAGVFGDGNRQLVERMLNTFIHRGPDDGHAVSGSDFALGARRLSIVDLEGGRQPLSNASGTIWAAQNGEIYNFPELRKQLLDQGHKLSTRCDTEVLPHLYQDYGAGFVEKIDGMFAIAIWDSEKNMGFLARDRMGKKPLYYTQIGSALYFASEIKALLQLPGFERNINLEALSYFLSFKHVPCPHSIFAGIKMLPPAHMLVFKTGQEPALRRYWQLDFSGNPQLESASEEEIVDELLELLKRAVKRRFMSDVPIGFFLSGGIDSSLSTALAAELCEGRIKTFTLTYEDSSTNEGKELDRYWGNWVAKKYGTEHHEEQVRFDNFPASVKRIISCFDEPFAGTMSTYFLAGLIARHVKVAFSGDGADELFGSYLSHRLAFPLSRYQEYLSSGDSSLIRPFASNPETLKKFFEPADWQWKAKMFVYSDAEKDQLFSADFRAAVQATPAGKQLARDFSDLTARDPLNRVLEAEYRSVFPDQVLAFVDRLSMAHSLEVRSAFLDTEFVSFVAGLPGRLKIKDGETKYILKKAALRYFPQEMVFRKKEGFLMPITQWFYNDLESYVRETLSPKRLQEHGFFDAAHVESLINKLYDGTVDQTDYTHVNRVFSLVIFQEWYELYMQASKTAPLSACNL